MTEDDAPTTLPDLEDLRLLLGIDDSGVPTLRARQAVGLIRHPHTPWIPGDTADDRLGALLVSPLALALRDTAWQVLLAEELTGLGPKESDQCLAERARLAGTSIPQLITALRPVLDLFDAPTLAFEYAAEHTKILFPEFYECAELWSGVFNEYVEDSSFAADEERATKRVLDSLADSDLHPDQAARQIGQFREVQAVLAADGSSPLLDGLRVRDSPSQGWPAWTVVVADYLETIQRDRAAVQGPHQPWIDPAPEQPAAVAPCPYPTHVPSALAQLFEAYEDEPIDPEMRPPGIGLARYVRNGFRFWHIRGTYSQLYDVLLAAAHSVDREKILEPGLAALLAEYVYGYLYIGYETGTESLRLLEIPERPMSGWEVRSLLPEIRDLMAIRSAEPLIESFARAWVPTAFGLAPLIGEIAELLALATTDTDLSRAMLHLGAAPDTEPPESWRTWLTDLSADAVRWAAAASELNPEP
jgi:hypothetical protein